MMAWVAAEPDMDAALWRRGFHSRAGCRPSFDERDACRLRQDTDSPDIETCGPRCRDDRIQRLPPCYRSPWRQHNEGGKDAPGRRMRITSRLLDGRQAAVRGLRLSVALEVARRDASDLTRALRAQAGWIVNPAESLDAEPGPGLPRYKVTVGAPEAPAGPAGWPRRKLLDVSGPAPVAGDAPPRGGVECSCTKAKARSPCAARVAPPDSSTYASSRRQRQEDSEDRRSANTCWLLAHTDSGGSAGGGCKGIEDVGAGNRRFTHVYWVEPGKPHEFPPGQRRSATTCSSGTVYRPPGFGCSPVQREVVMAEAREVFERAHEAFNAHDRERIRSSYGDRVLFTAPGEVRLEDAEATTDYAMSWLRAFPDARITAHTVVEEGSLVALQFTFEGTHTETLAGPEGEIPATNRRLSGRGMELFRVEGGKIVEEHLYFDQVQVMTQLGLMPEPPAAAS